MKKILYFCIVFVLPMGCATGQNKKELCKLRDSLDNMVFVGTLHNDTTILEKALKLSSYLLSVDTAKIYKKHCYQQCSEILASLGRIDEALIDAEHAIMSIPEDNLLRLAFFSIKYLKENNKDLADYYIEKIFAVCDSSLNDVYDEEMAINKIKAIYLRDGERKAKTYWLEVLNKYPDSPLLESLDEDREEWIRMNNEDLKLLNIEKIGYTK